MISEDILPSLHKIVDVNSIHVHNPTNVVFVCGGRCDITSFVPSSFRDLFMRQAVLDKFPAAQYVLAEQINAFFPAANYRDILTFERDLAQISDLILLFSESYGSAAELGSFAISDEIAKRLIVLIDDGNYDENSFVKLGPLRILLDRYGASAVCVLHRQFLGISNISSMKGINEKAFIDLVTESIIERRKSIDRQSTFSRNIPGHIAKFSVGIIQIYGALDFEELHLILLYFGVDITNEDLSNLLHCVNVLGWVKIETIGSRTFYIANVEKKAASLPFVSPKMRRKDFELTARSYWKENEPIRFGCIGRAAAGFEVDV